MMDENPCKDCSKKYCCDTICEKREIYLSNLKKEMELTKPTELQIMHEG